MSISTDVQMLESPLLSMKDIEGGVWPIAVLLKALAMVFCSWGTWVRVTSLKPFSREHTLLT